MLVIARPRQAGKTTEMVEFWANHTDQFILAVMNIREKKRIIEKYDIPKVLHDKIVTYDDLKRPQFWHYEARDKEILIDNADILLQQLYPQLVISGVTLSTGGLHGKGGGTGRSEKTQDAMRGSRKFI